MLARLAMRIATPAGVRQSPTLAAVRLSSQRRVGRWAHGDAGASSDADEQRSTSEIEAHVLELIEERVVPHVQMDGGDIKYEGFDPESGVVTISLLGACVDCPSATITMRFMIKNVLAAMRTRANSLLPL